MVRSDTQREVRSRPRGNEARRVDVRIDGAGRLRAVLHRGDDAFLVAGPIGMPHEVLARIRATQRRGTPSASRS